MKLRLIKKMGFAICAGSMLLAIGSCKKLLDTEPLTTVGAENMYRDIFDADAAVIGVYGKFMNLAKPYVIMNELRADLIDITANSDMNLRQLSEHTATADNPVIDPQPFYEVIVNCNDVLANFKKMYAESKLKEAEYNQRYSDIAAIRTWVYLQLGIHYGNIPYVTTPVVSVSELKNANNFPVLALPVLIDSLTAFTETLPFTEDYPAGTTLRTTVDGYNTQKFFINKNMLMGDLYLWKGEYDKAADRFKRVMEVLGPSGNNEQFFNQYRISSFSNSSISYGNSQNINSLVYTPGWRYLFERPQGDNEFNWEWIWSLPFDRNFEPVNPFIDLFSPVGGSYLLQPAQQVIDLWNSQQQVWTFAANNATTAEVLRNNFPFDSRGLLSYRLINGRPVVMKYLFNYLGTDNIPINPFSKPGKWFLSRAATLHLHYAEAANRAGKHKVAYALVNKGINYHYDPLPGGSRVGNVTNIQQTFLPWPYDFDAREGDGPAFRSTWYRGIGIRGRAGLAPVVLPATDSVTNIENMIMEENALELAFEGQRWSDLLRVAIRRNDPSFIADKVYDKLRKSGLSAGAANAARTKLLAKDWFLPFKLK
jgi:hypothetical protein